MRKRLTSLVFVVDEAARIVAFVFGRSDVFREIPFNEAGRFVYDKVSGPLR